MYARKEQGKSTSVFFVFYRSQEDHLKLNRSQVTPLNGDLIKLECTSLVIIFDGIDNLICGFSTPCSIMFIAPRVSTYSCIRIIS